MDYGLVTERKGPEVIFQKNGKKVINTDHGFERTAQRSKLSLDELKAFMNALVDATPKFDQMKNEFKKKHGHDGSSGRLQLNFLFFHRTTQQGAIIHYRPDNKSMEKKNHFIIITFLPRGKKQVSKNVKGAVTRKLFVESAQELMEAVDWVGALQNLEVIEVE